MQTAQFTEQATHSADAERPLRMPRGRLQTHTLAQVRTQHGPIVVTLLDVSLGGVAIVSDVQLQIGTDVEIVFSLPRIAGTVATVARIVWSDAMGHAGLHFEGLSEQAKNLINEFLK